MRLSVKAGKRAVGVVGVGHVGVAAAYALFLRRVADEIILVDKDSARAEGEAMDLMHAQAVAGHTVVRAGGYEDLSRAGIVVITAGANQKRGESRADLLARNVSVMREVAAGLDAHAPDATVLVATNPVDTLTQLIQRISARGDARVFGTGTWLDTARLRTLLGARFGVSARHVHAYVLGEHGDTEVPLWSTANVGGDPVVLSLEERARLLDDVRSAAYRIIERKGYTDLAIGAVIASIVDAVVTDEKAVAPVSVRLQGDYGIDDVCMSVPCVLGDGGVIRRLLPPVDGDELAALRASAETLRSRLALYPIAS